VSAARKIVIFVPGVHAFGGVERLLVDLSRFLHAQKMPHSILSLSSSIDLASYADWPMDVETLMPARNPLTEARALGRFFREPRNANIQAPLFFDLKSAFYAGLVRYPDFHLHLTDPPSLLPRDVSKFAFSLRHLFPQRRGARKAVRGEVVHRINRCGVGRAASLIAMTNVIAQELDDLYSRRATIIRPGVQPPHSMPSAARAGSGLRFLSVSRLEESKRIDWILSAFAQLEAAGARLSDQVDWKLDIVGDGSQAKALRDLSAQLGITDRVVFHGRLDDDQLEVQFAAASAFLMPAVQGYGLPALESLIRGVPVILHRQSGVSEIIDSPPWVETIERGADDLAHAIRRLTTNIQSGVLQKQTAPVVPTATGWANTIATACGWS